MSKVPGGSGSPRSRTSVLLGGAAVLAVLGIGINVAFANERAPGTVAQEQAQASAVDQAAHRATTVKPTADRNTAAAAQAPDAAPTAVPIPTGSSTEAAAVRITVPDGVGLDYQSAQDVWRAAGLHVAPAIDATGAHRIPVLDANWIVLSQDLQPGSKVPADTFITATVKKYSDD